MIFAYFCANIFFVRLLRDFAQISKIEAVADDGTVKAPAGANVIDLSNATVLPGMIESHTHLFLQGEDPAKGGYDIQLLKFYPSYRAARATVSRSVVAMAE